MGEQEYISVSTFCSSHQLNVEFIHSLQEFELIHLEQRDELVFPANDLQKLEQWVHMHFAMDINLEGLQAIDHLLDKMHELQNQVAQLRNKLSFYEESIQIKKP